MIYVGIDIAKQTHYAFIINSVGEVLVKPFAFSIDHSGKTTETSILLF